MIDQSFLFGFILGMWATAGLILFSAVFLSVALPWLAAKAGKRFNAEADP